MATATTSTGTVTYSNSTAAAADTFYFDDHTFGGSTTLDVMANDGGGAKTVLWSIDDGAVGTLVTTGGVSINGDLLTHDTTFDHSANGATISIVNNKVLYNASTLSDAFKADVSHLALGESKEDRFTYAIKLANGTLSWTTVIVHIDGQNDAPTVANALATAATEDGAPVQLDLLTGASDTDHLAALHVDLDGSTLPAGLSLNGSVLTIDPTNHAFQHLAAGATDVITLNYNVVDEHGASVAQSATITVTGVNDAASISGAISASLSEDATTPATGKLTVTDVDDGQAHTVAASGAGSAALGSYSVDADGNWSYTVDNAAAQHLAAGATAHDTFTVASQDGTASETVTVNITGVNDAASISGAISASLSEDATTPATGKLTVTDVDDGQAHTVAASGAGSAALGSYSVDADGNWSYTVDNAAAQHLAAGATAHDTFTVASQDGTASETVTVNITGVNDAASISGAISASLSEDATTPATGKLTVTDVDDGQAHTVAASGAGSAALGSYSVDADGNWSYTVDNAAVQHLAAGATAHDTFTVASQDGTASETVTVDITGVNDAASISDGFGGHTGSVTEDGMLTASGKLIVSDVDDDESHFQAPASLAGQYGTFTFADDGAWTYALTNGAANVQALNASDHVTDTLHVVSADGTATKDIVVNINGADDAHQVMGNTFDFTDTVNATQTHGALGGSYDAVLTNAPTGAHDFSGTVNFTVTGDFDAKNENVQISFAVVDGGSVSAQVAGTGSNTSAFEGSTPISISGVTFNSADNSLHFNWAAGGQVSHVDTIAGHVDYAYWTA